MSYIIDGINQKHAQDWLETGWAMSLGFDSADAYWDATNEAFAESVREYAGDE
jgi:hypothetical protein